MMSGNVSQKKWIGYNDKDIHHIAFPYPWVLKNETGESFFLKNIQVMFFSIYIIILKKNLNEKYA